MARCGVLACTESPKYTWKGFCKNHYSKWCKYGDPLVTKYGKHGMTDTPEHRIWLGMKGRCSNPNYEGYHNYGGRGIRVCDRWLLFANFIADMGHRPSPLHSIERIDNDGHYDPGNCKWATREEQNRNSRQNVKLTHNGQTMTIAEWADKLGIKHATLYGRIREGFPVEAALSTYDRRFHATKGERSF
jgi:hypothetical protein